MRIKLEDLQRAVLNIGFVGENKHSVIEIDCAREFDRYPDAIPTMVVTPPKGEPYPVVISWEDGIVFWEILGGDLARDGDGEIQLTFTQGDVIGKSYNGKTRIHSSITASGVMPEPWADWITEFTSLKDAAVLAKQGAETAKAGAETAQSLAETAQAAAETAQGLAETAQGLAETAQAAAETAQGAAEAAQTSAENAQAAAETAEGNATDSATAAAGSATAAAGSASDASGSATEAEVSATAAAGSASDAADSATAAAGSATEAASSASDAADSAADAAASAADAAQAAEEVVEEALAGKADKVSSATNGNFAGLDANGNLVDSGHKHSDYLTQHQSIAGKADKVSNATNGNFAGLDASGNLTDSGKKPGDFLTQHQDISGKADKASNATNGNFAALDANGNLKDSGHKHSDYLTQHQDISGKLDKPATAGTSGQVLTSDGNGGQSWQTPQSGGGTVTDVQVNGTSVLDGSVAKIPAATDSTLGVVKVNAGKGTFISNGDLALNIADERLIKNGNGLFNPIGASRAKDAAFYGLARAAGDTSQSRSSNPIGTYTDGAKAAIKSMLGVSDPEDLIDDTAGAGDTDKTFSANKLATDHSSLLNALNQKAPLTIIANYYDSTATYAIGDYCIHEAVLYKCNTAISTAEDWTAAHWTATAVMLETGGGWDVTDVQVNGTSILDGQGVANVPIAGSQLGVAKYNVNYGVQIQSDGTVRTTPASAAQIKAATEYMRVIVPDGQHLSTFYGLAKAAGADMKDISNPTVGQYPEAQKSAISDMLSAPETISGTTPTINAKSGIRYICGECATLDITVLSSGIVDVVFESGSTPTVLTVTPPTGMTMKWIGDDPTALEANKTYEINIKDGCLGMVVSWT